MVLRGNSYGNNEAQTAVPQEASQSNYVCVFITAIVTVIMAQHETWEELCLFSVPTKVVFTNERAQSLHRSGALLMLPSYFFFFFPFFFGEPGHGNPRNSKHAAALWAM